MPNVPDTNTFTLQNVYDSVHGHAVGTATNLDSCFTNSVNAYFDPIYGSKTMNPKTMYGFRNYRPIVNCLTCNVVLVWELNETSGGTAFDATGSYNGGYSGTPTKGVTGVMSYGLRINTEGDGVFNSSAPVSTNYTVSCWVKGAAATEVIKSLFWTIPEEGLAGTWPGTPYATTSIKFWYKYNTTSFTTQSYIVDFLNWRHVVVTRSTSGFKLYIDGSLAETFSTTLPSISGSGFYSGGYSFNTEMVSTYDQFAYWSRELTPSEVSLLYNSGSGLPYTSW